MKHHILAWVKNVLNVCKFIFAVFKLFWSAIVIFFIDLNEVCRGYGGFGALGHSVYHRELLPRLVRGSWEGTIRHIATSGTHTAAVTGLGSFITSSNLWLISFSLMTRTIYLYNHFDNELLNELHC